jgi:putative hydrolase of the HAD superfamily
MTIRAIVFDIGGVLEITPDRGVSAKWEQQHHFDEMCDLIIYSHEVEMSKPDRRIYELTCERLGVQPAEIVFLDDHEPCIVAAREFGMHAILFQETSQAIADIQTCLQTFAT